MRIWYLTAEKVRRCWLTVTTNADNFAAIYFSTIIFCETVITYSAKKTRQYFSNGEGPKREYKTQPTTSTITKTNTKDEFQLNLDEIDQFRFTRSQARNLIDQETKKIKVRRKDKHLRATRSPSSSKRKENIEYNYMNQHERNRIKNDKLNELAAARESKVRRSERNLSRKRINLREDVYTFF